MPWTTADPPSVSLNWTEAEQGKCVSAANSVLESGGSEQDAIFACIHAAGKSKEDKSMKPDGETLEHGRVGIKSLVDGVLTVEGYGIIWGGKDLEGEHFTPKTDLWFDRISDTPMVMYQHGQDEKIEKKVVGRVVEHTKDEVGLWLEAQIDLSDEYAAMIPEYMKERALGWSSGCVGHLAEVESGEIKSWPIAEFSLTPTPMEPRTLGIEVVRAMPNVYSAVKSLLPEGDVESPEGDETGGETKATLSNVNLNSDRKEENSMELTEERLQELLEAASVSGADTATKAVQAMLAAQAPTDPPGAHATGGNGSPAATKSLENFLKDVGRGNVADLVGVYGAQRVSFKDVTGRYDASEYKGGAVKQLSGGAGVTGGFLIPEEFLPEVTMYRDKINPFRQYAWKQPMAYRTLLIPALDQTGIPAAIDRTQMYGGVRMTWTEEAATKDETEPAFLQLELTARKLAGFTQSSDELLEDNAVGLAALLSRLFGGAIGFSELWAFVRGTGAGMPQGILTALHAAGLGPTIVVNRAVANQIAWADILGMEAVFFPQDDASCFWLANATCKAQIMNIVDGVGNLIWQPNAREGLPQTMLGRPIHWVYNQCLPPLGTQGDLMLIDGSQYIIGDKGGIAIGVSEHFAFTDDLTTWRCVHRVAGMPVPSLAFVMDTAGNTVSPFVILGDVAE